MAWSVDLFTGIGGFAVALKGIATPVLYCESDPLVRRALVGIMDRGRLPKAPIVDDVRDIAGIQKVVGGRRIDVLTAGFPCVGFSKRGYREGLQNEKSGLFAYASEVVKALNPRVVMFENVAEILTANGGKDLDTIWNAMVALGYSVRWTVVAASDVGAPHIRTRWFCLCVKGDRHADIPVPRGAKKWSNMPSLTSEYRDISRPLIMLGNSIVPMAARTAFYRLYSGFNGGLSYRPDCVLAASGTAKHACIIAGRVVKCKSVPSKLPDMRIILDPAHFRTKKEYVANPSRPKRSPAVSEPFILKAWPTPRTGGITHSHNLSKRTASDLATVAMYASSVNGVRQAKTDDGMRMNVTFVEWLMGYPRGYLGNFRE
jgi:DNA (cytosine-5)-methyltransferase 1